MEHIPLSTTCGGTCFGMVGSPRIRHMCVKTFGCLKKKKIQMIKSGTGADVRSSSTAISESVKDCVCRSNEKFSQSAFVCDMLIHLMGRYTVYVYIATQPGNLFVWEEALCSLLCWFCPIFTTYARTGRRKFQVCMCLVLYIACMSECIYMRYLILLF